MHDDLCRHCVLPERLCICTDLPQLSLSIDIIIFRHHKEARKASNSARIAALCASNIYTVDLPLSPVVPDGFIQTEETHLLYPVEHGVRIADPNDRPQCLCVIDGSWKQARKIYKKNPMLASLPHLKVSQRTLPPPRIRTPVHNYGMSTMEAIISALDTYGLRAQGDQLFEALCSFVEARRKFTGIRVPIPPGQSFSQVRKAQEEKCTDEP